MQQRPRADAGWLARHKVVTALVATVLVLGAISGAAGDEPAGDSADSADSAGRSAASASGAAEHQAEGRHVKKEQRRLAKRGGAVAADPASKRRPTTRDPRTFLVSRVIDGDTLELANGETVRLVGIDTPERGECGFDAATANLERLVVGKRVRLGISDEDRDGYGRLLRYVDVGTTDAGLRLVKNGRAVARYDSRDGYGAHPRERAYVAADRRSPARGCTQPAAAPAPRPLVGAGGGGGGCAAGYTPCVPPYGPDLDCPDVGGPIRVTGNDDPHGLDRDGDGVACE